MKLKSICILTDNVRRLYSFYSKILNSKGHVESFEYVEFLLGDTMLALYNLKSHNALVQEPVKSLINRSILIEIEVEDVDGEYKRVSRLPDVQIVKALSTQSWGSRSFYFKDPDGNVVNFFSLTS